MPDPAVQDDAVRGLIKMLAAGALGGAATRAGLGLFRDLGPRYEAPEPVKPVIVDLPRVTSGPIAGPIPISSKTKEMKALPPATVAKFASFWDTVRQTILDNSPTFTPPEGLDPKTPDDMPMYAPLRVGAAAGGVVGGYHLADKLITTADRRRAQADLEDAQREYQDAVIQRARPVKMALDRAYAAIEKLATDEHSQSYKTVMGLLFPGLAMDKAMPGAGALNLGAAGALGGLGAYMGYNNSRDREQSSEMRKRVARMDQQSAAKIAPPLVARIVPVPA